MKNLLILRVLNINAVLVLTFQSIKSCQVLIASIESHLAYLFFDEIIPDLNQNLEITTLFGQNS